MQLVVRWRQGVALLLCCFYSVGESTLGGMAGEEQEWAEDASKACGLHTVWQLAVLLVGMLDLRTWSVCSTALNFGHMAVLTATYAAPTPG